MRRWAAARPLAVREAPSRQTSVWREACPPARRPRRELRSARRLEARPGPAGLAPLSSRAAALRHRRYIPRRPRTPSDRAVSPDERDKTLPARNPAGRTGIKLSQQAAPMGHPGQNSPNTPQNGDTKPFLACRENYFTPTAEASRAGRTLYRTQDHLRDKTLPAQLISRSNGTKFSPLVIKRSFWPVLRMQGEFYPGYDIRGPQQGEFYPGILVALGLHPGSAMIIHVLLARQRP